MKPSEMMATQLINQVCTGDDVYAITTEKGTVIWCYPEPGISEDKIIEDAQGMADRYNLRASVIKVECLSLGNIKPNKINYKVYITSDEWIDRATKAKEDAGWRCQLCNRHKDEITLHAHHRTYENLGNEKPGDITVLCADCHSKFHGKS